MLHNMDAKYRTLSLKHLLWTALALGILADLQVWDRGPTASGFALWQSRIRGFIHGSLALGACLLLLWMADNPAARVASLNLQRHIENDLPLDTGYLQMLGTDAVPAVLEHFDALQEPQRCDIARQLLAARNAWQVAADEGWPHFSLSRSRALRAVAVREASLQALAADERTCPVSSPG